MIRDERRHLTRRDACGLLAACAVPLIVPTNVRAQQPLLPVKATDLDHFGITVKDSVKTAEFFARAFDPQLFREMDSPTRLYVKLATAHMAIGNRAYWTRDEVALPVLDHICARVEDYQEMETHEALKAAGIELGAGRNFPVDPDGLFLQLGGAPGGMSRTIIPAGRVTHEDAIVQVMGLDHIMVAATDLERSDKFYSLIFGRAALTTNPARLWYDVGGHTKLGVEKVAPGEKPSFQHFALRAAGFDRDKAGKRLEGIGAQIVPSNDEKLLRFRDPNGILVELKPG